MPARLVNLLIATAAAFIGLWLATHHPLLQPLPAIAFALAALASYRWPSAWLVALPTLVPVIGLAPWTGWLTFEETDLLVLAIAAGAYARHGIGGAPHPARPTSTLLVALAGMTALAIGIAMARGFADAGGFHFGWYQGYDGPMNSVRIGKAFFLALLLVPLFNRLLANPAVRATDKLAIGLAGGLGTAALAALWERLAFTDLLNFSTDYRTTGPFWEMHVGGAALDGWLMLTLPFTVWALRNTRSHLQWGAAAALLAMGAYASLTTFSRGVFLALPIALGYLGWQLYRQRHMADTGSGTDWKIGHWTIAVIALTAMSSLIFPTSGYRGLLALLGVIALALPVPGAVRQQNRRDLVIGIAGGMLAGLILAFLAVSLPKGPYILYALVLALSAACALANTSKPAPVKAVGVVAGFAALCLLAPVVAWNWGGENALRDFLLAQIILALPLLITACRKAPRWPGTLRTQGTALMIAAAVCGAISIFSGGAYMGDRFSTATNDLSGRTEHWRQAAAMLGNPAELAFGKGLGRFPANYRFTIPNAAFPGTYRWMQEGDTPFLKLVGARHPVSFGDIFRISQRLPIDIKGPFPATVTTRSNAETSLHLEICEKHLLYASVCQIGKANLTDTHGEWQTTNVKMEGQPFPAGPWYAPRLKVFSIGIGTEGRTVDLAAVSLTAPDGTNLLANGNFAGEMAHWFFSSDRDHLPWHAKSILVNILFDQGVLGLALFAALAALALWRLSLGRARNDPLSPYLGAGIVGLLAVGIFDSLLDVPRLALLFYLATLLSMTLGERKPTARRRKSSPRDSKSGIPADRVRQEPT